MERHWLSAHIFFDGDLNLLLRQGVQPLLAGLSAQLDMKCPYFFIRYGEEGPHIRLRLLTTPAHEAAVKNRLQENMAAFFQLHATGSNTHRIHFRDYLPETDRYGNACTLPYAEQLFYHSSAIILDWITHSSTWGQSQAFVSAIRLHLILLHATQYDMPRITSCCQHFINSWLPHTEDPQQRHLLLQHMQQMFNRYAGILLPTTQELWSDLSRSQAAGNLQLIRQQYHHIYRQYQQTGLSDTRLADITGSFLHMTNNRLGIANQEESFIVYLTLKCIEHIHGANTTTIDHTGSNKNSPSPDSYRDNG
ncbi:thiopeptide-type bacteriocin biosynthesis protein [Chitinophaga pendula]|uniref:thiopeptide-type bacteriocin biosynthesis protein n=1 Tax=Chitinophaga TaxID=79328 RepID=UPI000BB0A2D1|nr:MULTISPECIES: thiopeptide-type bacteriocin biosynthesis protein [Chitinophaga]ASZ12712.1 hypothetical protein CK934_17995 [Chitinophaga sp. MD30]UCJ09672.1 thiopeptide-type bacteriocin biosynthesis protein [Chitinophaga pendula]